MSAVVPPEMLAVLLESFTTSELRVKRMPIPPLRNGEVLVKMAAAPINPSDLVFLRNQYGVKKALPVVPGFEGAGTVVSCLGTFAKFLMGRRVACRAPEDGNGTWASHMVARAADCIPLLPEVTLEQGASLIVNPLTAWALIRLVKRGGFRSLIQTAAAGALGQMVARLARQKNLEVMNIVHRPEQIPLLQKEGHLYILNSAEPDFESRLSEFCSKRSTQLALDAVGGDLTAKIARCMGDKAKVIVYGALSGSNCELGPAELIFKNQRLEGFWLTDWVKHQPFFQKLWMAFRVQKLLNAELATSVQARFPLGQVGEAIERYKRNRSAGKVLLIPEGF